MNYNQNNKSALKWVTPEERVGACSRLCEHLKKGLSHRFWPEADIDTTYYYMKNYPDDFRPELVEEAKRVGLTMLESAGVAGTLGKIPYFNDRSWKFIMANKAGWSEKRDITSGGMPIINFHPSLQQIEGQVIDADTANTTTTNALPLPTTPKSDQSTPE